ncbi:protein-disulfide reductase DsbD domain-containing protein [Lutibacter sp.]|uniref:protein-disulfide reductase DsbD domain-containing protein n=1 Tax=Lutibacter sp. TaxID=1925666 RepID=UPI00356AD00E
MKKLVLALSFLTFGFVHGQILEPVKWATSVNKISETEYDLVTTATIEINWHLYSQSVPEDGPIPTNFTYKGNPNYLKKGNTIEDKGHTVDDPIFGVKIKYFDNKASFKQRIKLKAKAPFKVYATVEFMVCDDSRCLPPAELDLVFNIK